MEDAVKQKDFAEFACYIIVRRMGMKINVGKLFLTMYIFCFFFAPPFIPHVNFIIPLAAVSFILLITKYRFIINKVIVQSEIKQFLVCYFIIVIYCLLRMYAGNYYDGVNIKNYIVNIYRFILLCPVSIICILYILVRACVLKLDKKCLFKLIVYAGLLQSGICVLTMIFPSIKRVLLLIMLKNGDTYTLNSWMTQRRYFGFANNMFDTFGYGTGIIACIPFLLQTNKRYIQIIYFLLLSLVPFMNSRTGLVMIAIGWCCFLPGYIYRSIKNKKVFGKNLLFLICIFLSFYAVLNILEKYEPVTSLWVKAGMEGFKGIYNGDKSESVGRLFSAENWYLPKGLDLIFGTGHNIYEAEGYRHSDVGYINDIWIVGIFGAGMLYGLFGRLFFKAWKRSKEERRTVIFLAICFFIFNIKGQVIAYNTGNAVLLLLCFFIIFNEKQMREKGNETVNYYSCL